MPRGSPGGVGSLGPSSPPGRAAAVSPLGLGLAARSALQPMGPGAKGASSLSHSRGILWVSPNCNRGQGQGAKGSDLGLSPPPLPHPPCPGPRLQAVLGCCPLSLSESNNKTTCCFLAWFYIVLGEGWNLPRRVGTGAPGLSKLHLTPRVLCFRISTRDQGILPRTPLCSGFSAGMGEAGHQEAVFLRTGPRVLPSALRLCEVGSQAGLRFSRRFQPAQAWKPVERHVRPPPHAL